MLKREVRRLSAHLHRKEFPDWLLRPSFSSKDLSFTNRSFAWPGTPPPSAILDSGGPNHCGGSGRVGPNLQLAPMWPRACAFSPPAARVRPLSSCSCSSQTPPLPVARGLVSVCRLGQPRWGLSQTRASPSPFPRTTLSRVQLGQKGLCWGVQQPGVLSLPELSGVTGVPLPARPEPHVLGSSFPLVLQNGLRD